MTNSASVQVPDPKAPPENSAAIVMDGTHYPLDQLSKVAHSNIASIRFCDEEILQRKNQLAIADTARIAYEAALKRETAKGGINDQPGTTD